MNYEKLKAELSLPLYLEMSDIEATVELNEAKITVRKPVKYTDVASYLSVVRKLLTISKSTLDSAEMYKLAASTFSTFNLDLPRVEEIINSSLDALISDNLIDASDKEAILLLANTPNISRASELSLGLVKEGHVQHTRGVING
jgi:hypothetical protein